MVSRESNSMILNEPLIFKMVPLQAGEKAKRGSVCNRKMQLVQGMGHRLRLWGRYVRTRSRKG